MNQEEIDNQTINNPKVNEVQYAGLWIRVGASIIDSFVILPIGLLSFYNLLAFKSLLFMILLTILASLYKPLMEWRYGATLGKMAMKIKVVSEDYGFLGLEQAFGRYMPWMITQVLTLVSYYYLFNSDGFLEMDSFLELGTMTQESPTDTINTVYNFIFIIIVGSLAVDKRHQGFHDKIAKTFCIKVQK